MNLTAPTNTSHPPTASPARSLGAKLFLGFLVTVAVFYGVILGYHVRTPPVTDQTELSVLEQCRQLCERYGLVPTGHLKNDAETYLVMREQERLSAPLEELLSDTTFQPAVSESNPLLGNEFVNFSLPNVQGEQVALADLQQRGPVVVVFYYGYTCSHCVAQLFAIQKDLAYFRELGAEIVAISADTPEHTAEMYKEYGSFEFPVLSDPEYAVAQKYLVYEPKTAEQQEDLLHGTYVIDRTGKVVFAQRGYEPFIDNKSLLYILSGRETGSTPPTQVTAQPADATR